MTAHDELVANVIRVAGNEIVGRIRLQKIIYLLDQKGLNANAAFHYYHYGPYSRVIDAGIEKAKAFHGLSEEIRFRAGDGAQFSVFHTEGGQVPSRIGKIEASTLKGLVTRMAGMTSTVLELAATMHWLVVREHVMDWRTELTIRKGAKTEHGRVDQALGLLKWLSLEPSV